MKKHLLTTKWGRELIFCYPTINAVILKAIRYAVIVPALTLISFLAYSGDVFDAAKSGNLEELQMLIVSGSDVNEKGVRSETPLMISALAGHGEIVNYLLQRGAEIDTRNDDGMSPLHAAAYKGHDTVVSLLIAKGSDVNDSENRYVVSPLHVAAEENRLSTVILLVESGANTNATEINGYSALSRAGWRGHWDVVTYLLSKGADCQEEEIVGEWMYTECTSRMNSEQ